MNEFTIINAVDLRDHSAPYFSPSLLFSFLSTYVCNLNSQRLVVEQLHTVKAVKDTVVYVDIQYVVIVRNGVGSGCDSGGLVVVAVAGTLVTVRGHH